MNATERSLYYGRSQLFQQRAASMYPRRRMTTPRNASILVCAVIISAICGIIFSLRLIGLLDSNGKTPGPEMKTNTENRPRSEFLGSSQTAQCNTVCFTKECMRTAADILEMLDPEVSPCEDFYQYACGGFKRMLTEHKKKERYLWSVEYEAIKFLQDLIRQMPTSVPNDTFGFPMLKLRKFYDSCMDLRSLEENAIPTALRYLEYFGIRNWPNLDENYKFGIPDLNEILIRLSFYQLHPFFEVRPTYVVPTDLMGKAAQDFEINAETMTIQMQPSREPIFHSEGAVKADKVKLMEEILEFFVPNDTIRNKISTEVMEFDLAVFNVTQLTSERMEQCEANGRANCSTTSFYDCSNGGDQEKDRWCRISQQILQRSGFLERYPAISVKLSDGVHFQELGELIDSTDQRIIAHRLAIQFFMEKAISMNFGLRTKNKFDEQPILKKYFYEMNENRSPFCATWASYRLPELAETAFYYAKYHSTDLRREVNEMYSDIKEISHSSVQNISWIDSEAKESLDELFSKIEFSPGTLLQRINITGVTKLYQEVVITEESFLANDLESQKLDTTFSIRNMDMAGKASGIKNYPFQFNPHYSFIPRTIFFEYGNFLFPLVAANRPRYANLGTLGYVLGHELGHASQFLIGMFEKSEAFENALKERKRCLENDYFQYEVYSTGQKVKGNQTYHENIADFLGIRAAFKSLKKYQENYGEGERLPGLGFSNEKMFFLIAAQCFCEENNKESRKGYLRDRHSPPNVRINAMFKNYDAFSRAFDCAAGSPMNPISKCNFE